MNGLILDTGSTIVQPRQRLVIESAAKGLILPPSGIITDLNDKDAKEAKAAFDRMMREGR